jgi:hypothetical protein
MIKHLAVGMLAAACLVAASGAAHACAPPLVGDQFRYDTGPVFEIVKVTGSCNLVKLCVHPVGTNQSCRWIKTEHNDLPDVTWTVMWGQLWPPQPN